jgi:hypothetical protein
MIGDAVSDASGDCIIDGQLIQNHIFVLERFRAVLPAAPGAGHEVNPGQFFFGQCVLFIVNGPTTSPFGVFSQVIKDVKYTVVQGADTFDIIPKQIKGAPNRLPRFDKALTYPRQIRLKPGERDEPEAVVMWDTPGFIGIEPGNRDYGSLKLAETNKLSVTAEYHAFSFADCTDDNNPELATYRIDWSHQDEITVGRNAATTMAAARPSPPAPTFKAIPTGADFKPFTDAEANDKGPFKGWVLKPSTGQRPGACGNLR